MVELLAHGNKKDIGGVPNLVWELIQRIQALRDNHAIKNLTLHIYIVL